MIFSSKVWSCSLTESLESPSLSSKLGSTEERKQEHPNPSEENRHSGTAPLLSLRPMEGQGLPPFSRDPRVLSRGKRRLCVQQPKWIPPERWRHPPDSHTDPLPVPIWALKRSCKRDTSAERMSIPRRTTCKHRTDSILACSPSRPALANAPERREHWHTLPWEKGSFPPTLSTLRPSALGLRSLR